MQENTSGKVEGRADNVVQLGVHQYGVIPQPHAVILRKFPKMMEGLRELQSDDVATGASIVTMLGARVYDGIRLFIPDLMPRHEWEGFPSVKALEDDAWDEGYAIEHAPTIPQVFNAFDVAMIVNGGKRLKDLLGNALGPEMTRAVRSFLIAQMRASLSETSASLRAPKDGSETLTTSGASVPTPSELENAGSPSLVS